MSAIIMPNPQINLVQLKTDASTNIEAMYADVRNKILKLEK